EALGAVGADFGDTETPAPAAE
ncbi:MAG: hypothetical protein JWM87_87, partial [Candidatus Eremiobacteraeota bacterium]|nr:hypothetical protein [Candidatus Eremiobacteraeota bacterium]